MPEEGLERPQWSAHPILLASVNAMLFLEDSTPTASASPGSKANPDDCTEHRGRCGGNRTRLPIGQPDPDDSHG